jgi:phospholipid/cholesterol/gamma-HCH transport system ATP-binding protein
MPATSPPPPAAAFEMIDATVASIRAPDTSVLTGVNWTVRAGEFWVVVGLPGSGKSDLLTTAAGLMRPLSGVIRLFGKELIGVPEEERLRTQLRVGIVFGYGGRLFRQMSVAENLALPLCYHQNCALSVTQPRVRTVLERMELTGYADRTPPTINRSLRQRVALARALVLSPELLLLDDPLVGIDPQELRWWLEFLVSLLQGDPLLDNRPPGLILSTDNLQAFGGHSERFAFLKNGQFTVAGTKEQLAAAPNPALRELLPVDWLRA